MGKVMVGGKEGSALAAKGESQIEVFKDIRPPARAAAPALELVKTTPNTELSGESTENPPKEADAAVIAEDSGLEPEDHDLAERARKRIGKKHYEMKTAQKEAAKARAEADESERFAENLFNEREEWKKRAQALEAQTHAKAAPAVPELTKPDPDNASYRDAKGEFDWRKFSDDNATYAAKKAIADDRAEAQARAKQESEQKNAEAFKKRTQAAASKYPDWHTVVESSTVMLPNECLHYIARSEYGTDIAYFLAKNQDIAEKIGNLDPIEAVAELGVLKTSFEKPAHKTTPATEATSKTVERPGAPAPITPIATNGTGTINLDPSKMSYKELRAYEHERARQKR